GGSSMENGRNTTAQPYTMLCCSLGDLWKLWPDGRCCPIDDEDDLRDPKKIDELEPSPDSLKRLLRANDGQIITWIDCSTCGGSGKWTGLSVYEREWDDDHGWQSTAVAPFRYSDLKPGQFTDHGTVPCPDCNESGREPFWTGERV